MRWRTHAAPILILGVLALAAGCGPASCSIQGEVTMDGQPVENGLITYKPISGEAGQAQAAIKGGKYSIASATPGTMRVTISVQKAVGKSKVYDSPDSPERVEYKEIAPERYNTKSELQKDIKRGANTINWTLESK
jgi:hypothetical protein